MAHNIFGLLENDRTAKSSTSSQEPPNLYNSASLTASENSGGFAAILPTVTISGGVPSKILSQDASSIMITVVPSSARSRRVRDE